MGAGGAATAVTKTDGALLRTALEHYLVKPHQSYPEMLPIKFKMLPSSMRFCPRSVASMMGRGRRMVSRSSTVKSMDYSRQVGLQNIASSFLLSYFLCYRLHNKPHLARTRRKRSGSALPWKERDPKSLSGTAQS